MSKPPSRLQRPAFCALSMCVALAAAGHAWADLYSWQDPETKARKLSSVPPPWFRGGQSLPGYPKVDVLRDGRVVDPRQASPVPPRSEGAAEPFALPDFAQFQTVAIAPMAGTVATLDQARRRASQRIASGFPGTPAAELVTQANQALVEFLSARESLRQIDASGAVARDAEDLRFFDDARRRMVKEFGAALTAPAPSRDLSRLNITGFVYGAVRAAAKHVDPGGQAARDAEDARAFETFELAAGLRDDDPARPILRELATCLRGGKC